MVIPKEGIPLCEMWEYCGEYTGEHPESWCPIGRIRGMTPCAVSGWEVLYRWIVNHNSKR